MTTIPVGGSTGCDHQDNPQIDEAATWLVSLHDLPHPVVPALQRRFGLTVKEACTAIQEAALKRARAM